MLSSRWQICTTVGALRSFSVNPARGTCTRYAVGLLAMNSATGSVPWKVYWPLARRTKALNTSFSSRSAPALISCASLALFALADGKVAFRDGRQGRKYVHVESLIMAPMADAAE